MRIFVTGGAGYIGSHFCVAALQAGHDVVVFDNFCNSDPGVPSRIARIARRPCSVVTGDVRRKQDISNALRSAQPDLVVHLAGLKAVGDSVARPLDYFETNVGGTACLLEAMKEHGVHRLIFSSSATVYGQPVELPLKESHPLNPTNPYGRSKLMAEWLCDDFQRAEGNVSIVVLRYFNPVGAHPSGGIGDDPVGVPNNLMPFVTQVASGQRERLHIFGTDYPTPDGTGVRDYLHVCDLAEGHLAAISRSDTPGFVTVNLGTGTGYSVLDVVRTFERETGRAIPVAYGKRREGDLAQYYADPARALHLLNWRARRDLGEMCRDAWAWQRGSSTE
ncbi:UDP-glucose 4-epimerase GalE [Arvimicrobium flavum]|uniref:UDP-glucose 4-epimerase GalE n=1 Tax=Arvimicrobium flavum TaxID=3393320 RepID=UPI00237A0BB3|nr:UDP-glucose 4-epimerase GalE [Mesorhizobium shangrilense]